MADAPRPDGFHVEPAASAAEVAAILAAYEALWPTAATRTEAVPVQTDWRFAGRWWRAIGPRARMPVRP